ncbi:MAG: hypothetical protein EBU84_11705, partial [Actinobacteria bacterium]|nr:hypothetical protein [Actinomycetota bacterium]
MPSKAKNSRKPKRNTPSRASKGKVSRPKALADATGERELPEGGSLWQNIVSGRESDLGGVGLISVGLLLVLGVYFHIAGPVGRGITTALGWLVGVGRFLVPAVLIGAGVALVRRGSTEHKLRLITGWIVVCWVGLGFAHLFNGPPNFSASVDKVKPAGGWIGALIGAPLR